MGNFLNKGEVDSFIKEVQSQKVEDQVGVIMSDLLEQIENNEINEEQAKERVTDIINQVKNNEIKKGVKCLRCNTQSPSGAQVPCQECLEKDLDEGTLKPGDWMCSCSYYNLCQNVCCKKCGISRKKKTNKFMQRDRNMVSPKDDDWDCLKCNSFNFAENEVCTFCGSKRTSSKKRKDTEVVLFIPCTVKNCNRKYKTEKSWLLHLRKDHSIESPTFIPERIDITKKTSKRYNRDDLSGTLEIIKRNQKRLLQEREKLQNETLKLSNDCTQLGNQVSELSEKKRMCGMLL